MHPWSSRPAIKPVEGALFQGLGCATRIAGAHFVAPLHKDPNAQKAYNIHLEVLERPAIPPIDKAEARPAPPAFPTPHRDVTGVDLFGYSNGSQSMPMATGVWSGIYLHASEEAKERQGNVRNLRIAVRY